MYIQDVQKTLRPEICKNVSVTHVYRIHILECRFDPVKCYRCQWERASRNRLSKTIGKAIEQNNGTDNVMVRRCDGKRV